MIINICDRCGAPLPPAERAGLKPQDGRIRVNGADLCSECAAEFEEFMQGAAVLKWNPIKVRKMTDEERGELIENGYSAEQISELTMLDGFTPEDGEEILISVRGSRGKDHVEHDEAVADSVGSLNDTWLDSGRDWEDVTAWAAMPEPYKEGGAADGMSV